MKKPNRFQITKDDQVLIEMLWRWKLMTTTQIHLAVYKGRTIEKCYRRLMDLYRQRYVECFTTQDQKVSFWQLTEKGYSVLDFSELEMDHSGFRSENQEHDFWVNAIHLGAWINQKTENNAIFTEQQIRRTSVASFPKWVPHTKEHRPDGWLKVDLSQPNKTSLIAFEIELSKKAPVSYNEAGKFYSGTIEVAHVLWFVRTTRDAQYIQTHLHGGLQNKNSEHSFVLMDHFIKNQYQAKIILGNNFNQSISHILNIMNSDVELSPTQHRLLDIRKYPVNSNKLKIPDSVDLGVKRYMRNEIEV